MRTVCSGSGEALGNTASEVNGKRVRNLWAGLMRGGLLSASAQRPQPFFGPDVTHRCRGPSNGPHDVNQASALVFNTLRPR